MTLNAEQKEFIAWLVFLFNPLHGLMKKWRNVLPEGWEGLPYLVNFLITATAVFFIYHYAPPHRKYSLWLIPLVVTGLALITYLRW